MDSQRERIQDDLRGVIEGSVDCDNSTTLLYSTDGSIHQLRPLGVVCPRHWRDVVQTINYARENGLSVHPRGAGSFLAGESLGTGLILDFSRFMRRVIGIQDTIVRVQPGAVRERINASLHPFGLTFGPDGGNQLISTIGGQIAVNSAGGNWLRYGAPSSLLTGIKAVLADGNLVHFDMDCVKNAPAGSPLAELTQRLKQVYEKHAALIDLTPENSSIHHAGYNLTALRHGNINYLRLLAGSEGTLAAFTEFELRAVPTPNHTTAVLFFFDSIRKAALAAKDVIHLNIDSCDLMDRRHLHLISETDARIDLLVPPEAEAALLIFCSAETQGEIRAQLRTLNEHLCLYNNLAFAENYSNDEHELEIYNLIRNYIQPTTSETKLVEPVSYVDDVTVNPLRLDGFLAELLALMQSEEISSSIYCHAPQGQMCLHPFLNLHEPADRDKLLSFASKYYELAWKYGGYLGREHGSGISRQYFLKQQSPDYYEVYRDIKLAFDPNFLFQPGKIVSPDDSQPTLNLRADYSKTTKEILEARKIPEVVEPIFISSKESKNKKSRKDKTAASSENSEQPETTEEIEKTDQSDLPSMNRSSEPDKLEDLTVLQMDWRQEQVFRDCFTCNNCGSCRSQDPGRRACPLFRRELRETISPRAKANLIRAFALKQLELPELLSSDVKEIIDSCFNCRSCQFECSRHTPVPQMILQARSAYVSAMGLGFSDKLIAQFDKLSRLAIAFRPLASTVLKSPFCRLILEKTLGISSVRKVPPIPARSFLDEYSQFDIRHQDYNPESGVKRVFFFVSAFANYHDVALAEAVMKILQYNGIDVVCSVNQKPSGLSALTMGMRDKAAALARHNVNILADAIRDSCDIVCVEPADTYCIKYEYPMLLDREPDARLVSENIYDMSQYLWALHLNGKLNLKFQPINMTLGYHAPCRLRALNIGYPTVNLLRLIPGLTVETIEAGCCGMAGIYGMQSKNYHNSIRIGMPLINQLRKPTIQASTTDCSSCRIAMEHKSTKPCIHPIKILACSYGIMPEIAETLHRPARDYFLT